MNIYLTELQKAIFWIFSPLIAIALAFAFLLFQAEILKAWRLNKKNKRLIILVFVIIMVIQISTSCISTFSKSPSPTFVDVPLDHPLFQEIELLYALGYFAGCGEDPNTGLIIFCPGEELNIAEFSVVLLRLYSCNNQGQFVNCSNYQPESITAQRALPEVGPTVCIDPQGVITVFNDVPISDDSIPSWFSPWLCGVVASGNINDIVSEQPVSHAIGSIIFQALEFHPERVITRADVAWILRSFSGFDHYVNEDVIEVLDINKLSKEYPYANLALSMGYIGFIEFPDGSLGFCPECPITRRELAYWISLLIE